MAYDGYAVALRTIRPTTMARNEFEPLMTVEDLAAYLKKGQRTIRRYVARQEVPFFRVKGHVRFRRSDIDRWLVTGQAA